MTLLELANRWRSEAALLRAYGHESTALACERHAAELEEALRAAEEETLTLAEAARESGYSERRLREMLAEGRIPNAGRKHAPRIRRADLPRKARRQAPAGGYDPVADARAILGRAS